jgi:hypothetical protein
MAVQFPSWEGMVAAFSRFLCSNLFHGRLLAFPKERILFEVGLTPLFRQQCSNMFGLILGQFFCVNQFTHQSKLTRDEPFEVTTAP